ncbi:CYFA0S07e02168g1_1 [Cyberlindnera fabianii]|uniref:CYFA0S07e02168g1_1 n=1 Tax=Cyberlindnera fabianii TaxID=36022 RepID=A0A061AV36_CYBFA|nr:CYFA0S07e02168g1_1 [Cyberlindnera fabianii]
MQKFILLALAASFVAADKNSELEGLLADLKANLNDYLSQVSEGNTPPPQLLSLAQEARTYTDNSYTTLFDQVDINEVKSYVTGLPWYSSRLASLFDDDSAPSSSAPESSAPASSAPESSAPAETTAAESSAPAETTVAESSAPATTAVATVDEANGAMAYAPMALAALIPALL